MRIKQLTFEDVKWDKFCYESDECWYWHTKGWMDYNIEYNNVKDSEILSFYIEDGKGEILAICPLIREGTKLSFSGSYGPNPALRNTLSDKISKNLRRDIFTEINSIASEREIKECLMSISTLTRKNLSKFTYNFLMKYGFENVSLNTQILNLNKDERILWSEIKKSHRNEIKKGNSLFNFIYLLPLAKNENLFNTFKNLHLLAAGRKTRSDVTWNFNRKVLEEGNAVIVYAYKDDIPIGGIYCLLYKNSAYYGISANHPDYDEYPISHSIQWQLIKWLRNNRYKYFELGFQHFSKQPYDNPSQKEIDISLFKRHFGGNTITHYRGVKKF